MTAQPTGLTKGKSRKSAARRATVERSGDDVRRLGEALNARSADVVELTVARTAESGEVRDAPVVKDSFERIGMIATITVARWMAGGSPEDGLDAGREAWQIFGQLAAQRAAPLNEVTKRCLRWRDAAADVLRDSATRLRASPKALAQALRCCRSHSTSPSCSAPPAAFTCHTMIVLRARHARQGLRSSRQTPPSWLPITRSERLAISAGQITTNAAFSSVCADPGDLCRYAGDR
jgi:hypothetical protein